MFFPLILLTIILVFFLPIPLYFQIHYYENSVHLLLYGRKLSFKKRLNKKVKHEIKSQDYIGKINYYSTFFKNTMIRLEHYPIKPKLNLTYILQFGFEDAEETAIVFGLLNNLPSLIYSMLKKFFNIKDYHFSITPDFKKKCMDLNIKSILKISIANTIYIVILILFRLLKDTKIITKFNLTRRNNYGKSSN